MSGVRRLLADIDAGTRSERFVTAVLRQSIAVAGVFVLGWPALDAAVFFALESWLFLSFRAAAEIALDERTPGHGFFQTAFYTAGYLVASLPFFAAFIGCFAGFVVLPAFPADAWEEFRTTAIHGPAVPRRGRPAGGEHPLRHRAPPAPRRRTHRRGAPRPPARGPSGDDAVARPHRRQPRSRSVGGSADKARSLVVAMAVAVVLIEALPERFGALLPAPPDREPEAPTPPTPSPPPAPRRKRRR